MPAFSDIPNLIANGNSSYNKDVQYLGYRLDQLASDEANGHYNSLQMSLRGTFKSDLTYQFGYTLSKSIDPYGANSSAAILRLFQILTSDGGTMLGHRRSTAEMSCSPTSSMTFHC